MACVGAFKLNVQWLDYLPYREALISILDERFYTGEWLDSQILSGNFKVFTGKQSCILAAVKPYPTGALECHVMAATGELQELISTAIVSVEKWAQSLGCICCVIESRSGWAKIMKAQGYETYQTATRKMF